MLKMPVEEIIAKIKETKQLSNDEIEAKIKQKMDQLSGLISREGASHIVANELGVKLFPEEGPVKVNQVLVGMRSVELNVKIMRLFPLREFNTNGRQGKVASAIVADETGTMRITCWGTKADELAALQETNIIKLVDGYVKENNGAKEVHMNDRSRLLVNPPGITINAVEGTTPTQMQEKTRKRIVELTENANNIELLGTVVQVYDIKFFERCPTCRKRIRQQETGFSCAEHGAVQPDYAYVLNAILDDGSGNIRCVFFTEQIQQLLKKQHDDIMAFMRAPESFGQIKTDLLGEMTKLSGRVTKNAMFDRIEFMANKVDRDINPEEEIKRLQKELEQTETKPQQETPMQQETQPQEMAPSPAQSPTPTPTPSPEPSNTFPSTDPSTTPNTTFTPAVEEPTPVSEPTQQAPEPVQEFQPAPTFESPTVPVHEPVSTETAPTETAPTETAPTETTQEPAQEQTPEPTTPGEQLSESPSISEETID